MATTPNYSFSVYSSTDTDVRFLDFRVATAGSQSTSNFYVIDTVLKQHSDAIDSINATPSAFVVKGTYSSGSLYTASVANYPGYKNEQLIVLSLNQKNTGAVQININGTTNKDVMKYGSDGVLKAVDAGDFVANSPVLCLYDGTRFVVIGITSASSITVTGEAGDILQIADDGTIESSGKKAAQPNGIATLDENGNVVQVANMANSAAAVYSGAPVSIAYAGAQRIASITAYGENAQGGTTEAPVALTGVDSVFVSGNNLLPKAVRTETTGGITFTPNPDGSILVSGTATTNVGYSYAHFERALLGRTVCLSGGSTQAQVLINERLSSGAFVRNVLVDRGQGISGILTKQKEDNIFYATIQVLAGTTVNTTIYPMLNLGESPLPYEPYQGSVTQLPIPRPLRRVGDVKDKCITRVKRIYDKRIVLDGAEDWKMGGAVGDGAPYIFCDLLNDHYQAFPIISSRFPSTNILASNKNQGIGCWDRSLYLRYDSLFTNVEELKTYLSAHPLTVYYQSTAYDGTNGLDVCLTEYQNGFVELDGTEASHLSEGMFYLDYSPVWPTPVNRVNGVCSHYPYNTYGKGKIGLTDNGSAVVYNPNGDYTGDEGGLANWKAYLAAQKAAGTPVQVAYQLAAPEVYATDPLDIDNAAGPLTVMTGGEVEVRMTELIGSRSDVSNNTVAFSEASQDADIQTGEKLSVLFGKIKKRFSVLASTVMMKSVFTQVGNPNLLGNSDFKIWQRGTTFTSPLPSNTYTADRWRNGSGQVTFEKTSNGAKQVGVAVANCELMAQRIEHENGTFDFTFQMKLKSDGPFYLALLSGDGRYQSELFQAKSDFTVCTATFQNVAVTGNMLNVYIKSGLASAIPLTVEVMWAKLEHGTVATPYVPKGYGAELAECLRYYWKSEMPVNIFKTTATPGDYYRSTVYFPVPMRIVPTVTILSKTNNVSINRVTADAVKFEGQGGNDTVDAFEASADL